MNLNYDIYFIINEITEFIRDNLLLFVINDQYLINLKKFCQQDLELKFTPYNRLVYFTEEALSDLINVDYLYDFRDIE